MAVKLLQDNLIKTCGIVQNCNFSLTGRDEEGLVYVPVVSKGHGITHFDNPCITMFPHHRRKKHTAECSSAGARAQMVCSGQRPNTE
jgi:hypothetical protein